MMVSRGLGAKTVAVVDDPAKCPTGTWSSVIAAPTGSSKVYYECNMGEPWHCVWFGWGCKGVPAVPPAAPQTREQVSTPGQWTPETSAYETWRNQQELTEAWLRNTEGIATVPSWMSQTGETIKEAVTAPSLWFIVGAAAVVAVIILAKRV